MILLVDVGNSRLKWLLWDRGCALQRGGFIHKGADPAALASRSWKDLSSPPSRVIVANVAGPLVKNALADWIASHWAVEAVFAATAASGYGIRNSYAIPERMGVDRWVAMIGARALAAQACCIVDCGTAVTVDALAANGEHLGGVIMPGVRLMREALYRDTRQIPMEDSGVVTVFGHNTRDCVWGGTAYAVAGAIDRVAARMEAAMAGPVCRLLTGGDAEAVLPMLEGDYRLAPDLIFDGLLAIGGEKAGYSPSTALMNNIE